MATATAPELRVEESALRSNPPHPHRTTAALRELGYDSYSALADLVDNSVDAGAQTITITIAERQGDIVIDVTDDGCGMDEEVLDEALRIGSDTGRNEDNLGKFGMGLVTASISVSRKLEVFTRVDGSPVLYAGFDLDMIQERNEFIKWLQPLEGHAFGDLFSSHGTKIRLSKTDRINNRRPGEFANVLRKRLGQTFRKYLKAGLKIVVNQRPVEVIDPLMLADPHTTLVFDEPVQIDGGSVHLRVVDLPDYGTSGNSDLGITAQNSGFYVLRNNREIMQAETFDFYKKHPDYSHFRAELEFDGSLDAVLHTDIKKMTITPSQSVLDKIRSATQGLIKNSGIEGRRRASVARGAVDHSLAESNIKRRAQLIPKPRTLVEKREPKGGKGSHSRGNGEKPRSPHVTHLQTSAGLRVVFNEGDYGEAPFYSVRQDGATVVVTYNREHPFWRELIEHANEPKVVATLDYLVFGLANAELLVPEQARIVKENVNATLVGLLL